MITVSSLCFLFSSIDELNIVNVFRILTSEIKMKSYDKKYALVVIAKVYKLTVV